MSATDRFLDLYKKLEQTAIDKFGLPADGTAISKMERMSRFSKYRSNLKYCREVRALLQHQPKINDSFAVTPSEEMIVFIDSLIKNIISPLKCIDICIPRDRVLVARPADHVFAVMKEMKARGIANVPIIDRRDYVCGIFSENTVFSYVTDIRTESNVSDEKREFRFTEDIRFSDIAPLTSGFKRGHTLFKFIQSNRSVEEAEKVFYNSLKKGERIALLLLTDTGKNDSPLRGIVTPWDIIIP